MSLESAFQDLVQDVFRKFVQCTVEAIRGCFSRSPLGGATAPLQRHLAANSENSRYSFDGASYKFFKYVLH